METKIAVILLGCQEPDIMEERLDAGLRAALPAEIVFLVSGTPKECQFYKELLDEKPFHCKAFYDNQAKDTLSNAEGIKKLIEEENLEKISLLCCLSKYHAWRFKKCLKMVKIKDVDLRFSTSIHEAKGEWIPVLLYFFGPIGIRFASWLTKTLR